MAVNNYTLNNGSLVIGDTTLNYGGADGSYWNGGNAAGLMVECDNYTEIVVHDNDTSLASFMYYDGIYNKLYIGRNKGWGVNQTQIVGTFIMPADIWILSSDASGGLPPPANKPPLSDRQLHKP